MENNKVTFKGFQIIKFGMEKNVEEVKDKNIEIETTNFYNKKNKNMYKVMLSVDAISKFRKISVEIEGIFEFDQNSNEEFIKEFLDITAPSILYPYCRAFISNVTSYDAHDALILPVLNFAKK